MNAKEQRRNEWLARITDFRASGLTIAAWCAVNQCSINQMKYWLYKSKIGKSSPASTEPNPAARFVPLAVTNQTVTPLPASSLVVRIGQVSIELHPGFDPKLLREVVHTLESSC